MALSKSKTADGKVNFENITGRPVPKKSTAGLSKASGGTNSLPQPGTKMGSPLSAGASPRRATRSRKPGPTLPPVG